METRTGQALQRALLRSQAGLADRQQQHSTAQAATARTRQPVVAPHGQVPQSLLLQRALAGTLDPASALTLQRTAGNRALNRLLGQRPPTRPVQARLTVGPASDRYEQEADRVAAQVTGQAGRLASGPSQGVQCQDIPRDEALKRTPLADSIQRRATSADGMEVAADVESSIQSARGGGQALPRVLRSSMEGAFGADFSGVRVHTGSQADTLNRSVQARAFTTGPDIFFRQGEYSPGSPAGQRLLAHELTHVVQQNSAPSQAPARQTSGPATGHPAGRMGRLHRQPAHLLQRMKDEDGSVQSLLERQYQNVYKKQSKIIDIPKPAQMKKIIRQKIAEATGEENAVALLIEYLLDETGYRHLHRDQARRQLETLFTSARKVANNQEKRKRKDLKKLNELKKQKQEEGKKEGKPNRKRKRSPEKQKKDIYTNDNYQQLSGWLKQDNTWNKLYSGSEQAQKKRRTRSHESVGMSSKLNKLTEHELLSMGDLLQVQNTYEHSSMGDSLLLEKGEGYQVTMSRSGGQEIHQLGPYESGGKKPGVQDMAQRILNKHKAMTSQDLSRAITIRDPQQVKEEFSYLDDKDMEKIRAMRQLFIVEQSRGPEVALGTVLRNRSSSHGYEHFEDYLLKQPLAPPQATTNLRVSREKRGEGGGYNYIPQETQQRTRDSIFTFVDNVFKSPPEDDPAIDNLMDAMLEEIKNTEDMPSFKLIEAMDEVMGTPYYNQWDPDETSETPPLTKETGESKPMNETITLRGSELAGRFQGDMAQAIRDTPGLNDVYDDKHGQAWQLIGVDEGQFTFERRPDLDG